MPDRTRPTSEESRPATPERPGAGPGRGSTCSACCLSPHPMERGPRQPRRPKHRRGSSARGLSTGRDAYSLLLEPRPPPRARAAPRRRWAWRACSPRASPATLPASASAAPPAPPPPCCGVRVEQPRPHSGPHSELPPAAQRRERGPPHCAGARISQASPI